ncbi:MAG: lipoyl protein ligase domain-containing protein [Acidimicrobiales bacterium]
MSGFVDGSAGRWRWESLCGPAADLLARPWPEGGGPRAWELTSTRPTVVLGSTQPQELIDRQRLDAAGMAWTRRRSGGGVVLVDGGLIWVDVFVPADDRQWTADVSRAFWWLGECWVEALETLGIPSRLHREPPAQSTPGPPVAAWNAAACFARLGSGEVSLDSGHKVVGVSARRRRDGALFQCAALVEGHGQPGRSETSMDRNNTCGGYGHDPSSGQGRLADVLALASFERAALADRLIESCAPAQSAGPPLVSAFRAALAQR